MEEAWTQSSEGQQQQAASSRRRLTPLSFHRERAEEEGVDSVGKRRGRQAGLS